MPGHGVVARSSAKRYRVRCATTLVKFFPQSLPHNLGACFKGPVPYCVCSWIVDSYGLWLNLLLLKSSIAVMRSTDFGAWKVLGLKFLIVFASPKNLGESAPTIRAQLDKQTPACWRMIQVFIPSQSFGPSPKWQAHSFGSLSRSIQSSLSLSTAHLPARTNSPGFRFLRHKGEQEEVVNPPDFSVGTTEN